MDGFKISDPWQQLRKIRIAIGKKCNWAEEKNQTSLYESVKWLQMGPYLSANNPRKVRYKIVDKLEDFVDRVNLRMILYITDNLGPS